MALARSHAEASTLADVIRQIIDAFREAGDSTPIQVGAQHRENFGAGSGPKILFVLSPPGGGKLMGGQSLGATASQVYACDVYVRAVEPSTDALECADALDKLQRRLVDYVSTACSGRIEWGPCSDDSPLRTPSGLGTGYAWSFAYRADIRHDAARWRGPLRDSTGAIIASPMSTPPDVSPPILPTSPAAIPADGVTLSISVTAKD